MLRSWQNPEFMRHYRAELRRPRVVSALALLAIIHLVIWMFIRTDSSPADLPKDVYITFFNLNAIGLVLWVFVSCGNAICGERLNRTADFQRTTSLTAAELVVGKLFGTPVLPYFLFLCAMPLGIATGSIAAGYPFFGVIASYLLILIFALVVGLVGLAFSSLLEKPSTGVLVLGLLALYSLIMIGSRGFSSMVPGVAAISPIRAIVALHGGEMEWLWYRDIPTFFGIVVPWIALSLLLYASIAVCSTTMLLRTIKRQPGTQRLLSNWQTVGLLAYINLLFYALLTTPPSTPLNYVQQDVTLTVLLLNFNFLFILGLITISPPERLKIWYRKGGFTPRRLLADDGVPWPWQVLSAIIAFASFLLFLIVGSTVPLTDWNLAAISVRFLVILVFAIRDVFFVQWCVLTKLKRPVITGVLLIVLYYVGFSVAAAYLKTFDGGSSERLLALSTPFPAFTRIYQFRPLPLFLMIPCQAGIALAFALAIKSRLSRRPLAASAAA
jgi:hypothetical protein